MNYTMAKLKIFEKVNDRNKSKRHSERSSGNGWRLCGLCRRVALHARGYQRYCKMLGTAYKAT
jgi:hypothetical protein